MCIEISLFCIVVHFEFSTTWKQNVLLQRKLPQPSPFPKANISKPTSSPIYSQFPSPFKKKYPHENIYLFGHFPQTTGTIFTLWHFSLSPREHMSSVRLNTASRLLLCLAKSRNVIIVWKQLQENPFCEMTAGGWDEDKIKCSRPSGGTGNLKHLLRTPLLF